MFLLAFATTKTAFSYKVCFYKKKKHVHQNNKNQTIKKKERNKKKRKKKSAKMKKCQFLCDKSFFFKKKIKK